MSERSERIMGIVLGRSAEARVQHLSDEAIAAFADDVLTGHARERARRHTTTCAECNHAVAVQREAVWALRSAPAPSLPSGLLDRLRDVPVSTPIRRVPTVVDEQGTPMFATFGPSVAAFVPQRRGAAGAVSRHARPFALTAASVAFLGALAGSAFAADSAPNELGKAHPASVREPTVINTAPTVAKLVRAALPGRAR